MRPTVAWAVDQVGGTVLATRLGAHSDPMVRRGWRGGEVSEDRTAPSSVPDRLIRVFVLEEEELDIGLVKVVDREPDLTVVGDPAGAPEAMRRLAERRSGVVLLDIRQPTPENLRAIEELRSANPEVQCLVLTSLVEETLSATISRTPAPTDHRTADPVDSRLTLLTPQERRLLDLVGHGLTNREIGEQMHLAEQTVKNYVSNMLKKLGMRRRAQVAAYAARLQERQSQNAAS